MKGLSIRDYRAEDAAALALVFHRAVRRSTAGHYTLPQRLAWSPWVQPGEAWHARLARIETVVADLADGQHGQHGPQGPVGFMALDLDDGFLDFAYVDPAVRGQGVAAALYAELEGRARARRLARLETEASRVAEPFFLSRGWTVLRRQVVRRHGVRLPNAVMERDLGAGEAAA
jgi:putative acetyltransferase